MKANPMRVEVRRIRPEEWRELKELRLRALADAPRAFDSTLEREGAQPDSFWQELARGSDRGINVFGFLDAALVGMCCGMTFDDEEYPQLVALWVDPEFRGRGVGDRLVDVVVEWARDRGSPAICLWVSEANAAAADLYRRCGFQLTGRRMPLPTHPGVLEVEMRRDLERS